MKKILLVLAWLVLGIAFFTSDAAAQGGIVATVPIRYVAAVPATCSTTDKTRAVVYKYTAPSGLWQCSGGVYVTVGGGGGVVVPADSNGDILVTNRNFKITTSNYDLLLALGTGRVLSSGNFITGATEQFAWSNAANAPSGTRDTSLSRQAAGVVRVGDYVGGLGTLSTGGLQTSVVSKTANYTVTLIDHTILANTTAGAFTVTLPNATTCAGQEFIVKDWKGTALTNNITVATTSAQTIDGATTKVINTTYGLLRAKSDGANWFAL